MEKRSKTKKSNIKFLNYVISADGERFDSSNSILDFNVDDDINVGTWFRNFFWGNCRFQAAVVYPQGKRSADIRVFGNCPFINGDTIEIKTIKSKRKDGLVKRLREAQGQSENVIIDISSFPYDEKQVRHELMRYLEKHKWLKVLAVKKDNQLLFAWKFN